MNNENVKLDYAQMEAAVTSINSDIAAMLEVLNTDIPIVSYTGEASGAIQDSLDSLKTSLKSLETPINEVLAKVNEISAAYKETESKINSSLGGTGGTGSGTTTDNGSANRNANFARD